MQAASGRHAVDEYMLAQLGGEKRVETATTRKARQLREAQEAADRASREAASREAADRATLETVKTDVLDAGAQVLRLGQDKAREVGAPRDFDVPRQLPP